MSDCCWHHGDALFGNREKNGECHLYAGEIDLFIYPGFQFNCVDAFLTNFHLPKSTLLMLVCAFGGYELVMGPIKKRLKTGDFFSYGDAMLIS
ncbi:S-adenosylmethionine:tRNA ribosyltransferase-isomerase [Coxiella endosymbiont of Ornithodoros amblus]|uniref:S-adenosylmethionine:tRNA ribosyltransferase-isomerase n=1 Tax=Coxiella endosymbiont of Ornithodoros amblus TaxID=1656166 RepID=UPI003CC75125